MPSNLTAYNLVAQIALTVFYNTPTAGYSNTFFNRTVDIIEPPQYIDTQLLFLWLLLLAGLGAAGGFRP